MKIINEKESINVNQLKQTKEIRSFLIEESENWKEEQGGSEIKQHKCMILITNHKRIKGKSVKQLIEDLKTKSQDCYLLQYKTFLQQ